jgi:hypothetical protein
MITVGTLIYWAKSRGYELPQDVKHDLRAPRLDPEEIKRLSAIARSAVAQRKGFLR